jgi:hypothetical protein
VSTTLKQQLAAVHTQLSEVRTLDGETRQLLLVVLADISRLLEPAAAAASEASPTEAFETIAARFDADHPALSTAVRQLIDALAKAGI